MIQLIQAKLKQTVAEAEMSENSGDFIKEQAMKIASSKDLDVLLAELKGDKTDALIVSLA